MTTKMQSCVDHIKTSCDVDPWAAEMVEKIFTEYDGWFDKVLEIIDQHIHTTFLPDGSVIDSIEDVEGLRDAIEDLKGGEQE